MNALDVLLLVLIGLAAYSGFRRGALLQVLSYGGLAVGLVVGALLGPSLASLARSHAMQAGIAVAVLLGAGGIGNALGWALGGWVRARARRSAFGPVDAGGGMLVSVVAVLLATWFVALNLVNGPFPTVAAQIRGSAIVRGLDASLPRPPSLLAEIRGFFNRYGFPDVFVGLPPAPAGPVQPPTAAEARQAFRAAEESTVRIVGQACGEIQSGSGFVVADHYVVTNAHVVAGVEAPEIQVQGGGSEPGTTVLFDPRTDLALLYVQNVPGPSLDLDRDLVERGATGSVLGYPGGGSLRGDAAAVRGSIDAVGRDIYGKGTVQRQVYELQTSVIPGDSGGPFVLVDGTVAGVVFAASTTDPSVGYAIASTEVLPRLNRTAGGTAAVSTGPCVR
ncbi:MAG TPA: MarP family serine protease [Actinomycetota bacterium]